MSAIVGIDAEVLIVSAATVAAETTGRVLTVAVNAGGTGYSQGQTLTISGGGGSGCTLNIDTVAAGVVTAVSILTPGEDYAVTTGAATTGGGGTGCTINILTIHPLVLPTWSSGPQTWDLSVNGTPGYSWTKLTERNEVSININVDIAEHKVFVTNVNNAWVEKSRLYMDWSGSIAGYYDDANNDIFDTMKAGLPVWLLVYQSKTATTKYFVGKVLLTSVDHSVANEDYATLDVDFEGMSALYKDALPTT